jgi:peptidoglycan/LPS O-acetylase OafA/YrhL
MPRRLLLLNGLAILCVILFHAVGWGFTALFAWPHRYLPVTSPNYDQVGSLTYYGLRVGEQLVAFSIPAFLFVSGFFVAFSTGQHQPTVAWKVIWTRIRSLWPPYLFWSIVLWVWFALQGLVYSAGDYVRLLLTGATNPAFYFVILLTQFYLLSPLIVRLARWNWKWLLLLTALLQLSVDLAQYVVILNVDGALLQLIQTLLPKWLFLTRLFWFVFGVVFGFQLPAFKRTFERTRWPALAATLGLFILGLVEWEWLLRQSGQPWIENRLTVVDSLYGGAFIVCFLGFAQIPLWFSNQLSDWGSKSFGIYLVHSPVMEVLARGLYHFAPALLGQQLIFQPLLIVFGLGVPLLLMALVRRSPARALYPYLFG